MPGVLVHVAFGVILTAIAIHSFSPPLNTYWHLLLLCIVMSCLPDAFYPFLHSDPEYDTFWRPVGHIFLPIVSLLAIIVLLKDVDIANENIVIIGLTCVIVHAIVDYVLPAGQGRIWI